MSGGAALVVGGGCAQSLLLPPPGIVLGQLLAAGVLALVELTQRMTISATLAEAQLLAVAGEHCRLNVHLADPVSLVVVC